MTEQSLPANPALSVGVREALNLNRGQRPPTKYRLLLHHAMRLPRRSPRNGRVVVVNRRQIPHCKYFRTMSIIKTPTKSGFFQWKIILRHFNFGN